jgi:hypothetical protein
MYEQIDQLRKANLISEQEAAAARVQVWAKSQEKQLEVASNFFGQLSVLQKSENKKIAAVGKAAAIAQAIVDTYKAATSAYAAMAGIPYVGPGLGAAAAAAAVAAGMANVNAIRAQSTGFMDGGYTGDFNRTTRAGDVHGREFVMDSRATDRIGTADLEALRTGAARVQRNADALGGTGVAVGGRNGSGGASSPVNVSVAAPNVQVAVIDDASKYGDWLASSAGDDAFKAAYNRNRSELESA